MTTEYPGAIDRPGPPRKQWSLVNLRRGVILHSMEGWERGAWSVIDDIEIVNGRWRSPQSWHFSVMQDGRVFQHYSTLESPWHAGNKEANTKYIGIEHEGEAGQPLTQRQLEASKSLVSWLSHECGWTASRKTVTPKTLWEHREVSNTTCPNGRIPWAEYEESEMRTVPLNQAETLAAFNQLASRLGGVMFDDSGETMERVVDPAPPPGYGRVTVTYKL